MHAQENGKSRNLRNFRSWSMPNFTFSMTFADTTVHAFNLVLGWHCFSFSALPPLLNTFKIRLFHDSVGNAIFLSPRSSSFRQ